MVDLKKIQFKGYFIHKNDSVDTIGLWVTNGFNMADTIITGISKWIRVGYIY